MGEPAEQPLQRRGVERGAEGGRDRVPRPGAEHVVVALAEGHPDDRDLQAPVALDLVQGREQLLERQVPGGPEEDHCVARRRDPIGPRSVPGVPPS
jgi:hypothetical protein